MSLLSYIGNVVTGRIAHWNSANNQVTTRFWNRAEQFPKYLQIPVKAFVACSSSLVDVLLGPDQGSNRLLAKDPLEITASQFTEIHTVVIESLAGVFLQMNPSFAPSVAAALTEVTGRNPIDSRAFRLIGQLSEPDVWATGKAVWEELVSISGSKQGTGPIEVYHFAYIMGSVSVKMVQRIRREFELSLG